MHLGKTSRIGPFVAVTQEERESSYSEEDSRDLLKQGLGLILYISSRNPVHLKLEAAFLELPRYSCRLDVLCIKFEHHPGLAESFNFRGLPVLLIESEEGETLFFCEIRPSIDEIISLIQQN